MSKEVTSTKSLQDRVGDRIREQIGDLLTTEDLTKLVEAALQDAFFKERVIQKKEGWNTYETKEPAQIVKLVNELLKSRVDEAVKSWLDGHKQEFKDHLDDAIGTGFSKLMQTWIDGRTQTSLYAFAESMKNSLGIR